MALAQWSFLTKQKELAYTTIEVIAQSLLVCVLLYLPWFLYQKLFDPPGDRLLKWHLASVEKVDRRPFLQALTDSYSHLIFSEVLPHNREMSGKKFFDHIREYWSGLGELIPALPRGSAGQARVIELLVVSLIWMFPPQGGTICVQWYVTMLLGFTGSTLALWAVSRWLALGVGAAQIALNFLAYGVYMREPGPPGMLSEGVCITGISRCSVRRRSRQFGC